MTPRIRLCIAICATLFIAQKVASQNDGATAITPIGEDAFAVMREFFEYDRGIPLDAHVASRRDHDGYVREKIVFCGMRDRVPGFLAVPTEGAGPFPCVILIHGVGGSKEDWWKVESFHSGHALTTSLLDSGMAVLTLDAEFHGERAAGNDFESPEVFIFEKQWFYRARNMVVDSTLDHRRALDYLATREDIDTSRIGVLGYSMGGMMALQLAAVDERISACTSCVAPILKGGTSALGIHNFAPYITNTPVLMMIGREDHRNYSVDDAQAVLDLIPTIDRSLEVFESGHKLPIEWTTRAHEWMSAHLE